jgi:hypothetical protein
VALTAVLLIAVAGAQAQWLAPDAPTGDDSTREYGDEWVNDYPSGVGLSDLSQTDDDARGLGNQLASAGWTWRFDYGNGYAWEEDWKRSGSGGTEYNYVDTVDMAYFSGHGSSTGFYVGVGGNTHDDSQVTYSDCYMAWGDGDADWVGISACNVLDDPHLGDWAWCMNKLHLILGFKTTMADTAHGVYFGDYLRRGYNMRDAWFLASDRSQPAGKIARILAEEDSHFYDKLANHTGGDTWDDDYYWSDHKVGCEPPRQVNIEQLNGTMPVFMTPPLSLAEREAKWDNLGSAFGVTTTRTLKMAPYGLGPMQDNEIWSSPDGQLQMDASSGLYAYADRDDIWVSASQKAAASVQGYRVQVTQDDARQIAEQFLISNDLMPADAHFYEVVADTQTGGEHTRATGLASEGALQSENLVWQVVYSRVISYTPPSAAGVQEPLEFSVVGPGAKLKVYVPTEAVLVQGVAQTPTVVGGVGGWRAVGGQSAAAVRTVEILSYDQILKLFNDLEPTVALGHVPVVFETREVISYTIGEYEHPLGTGQDQLIPVYILDVRYHQAGSTVVNSLVHLPANPEFSAPLARITPISQVPEVVRVGQQLVFQATDASRNLSDLGYDASLNFPLGTGDPDSYLYTWYRDAVATENRIGTGRTLTYNVGLHGSHAGAGTVAQTIILEVNDSASPRPPSTMTASFQINVARPTYLPLVRNR